MTLVFVLGLMALGTAAKSANAQAQGYEQPPIACPPPPGVQLPACPAPGSTPPPAAVVKPSAVKHRPTSIGGYTAPQGAFFTQFEVGYPFLAVELGYGISRRVQLSLGYRGLYSFSHSPYASLKIGLRSPDDPLLGMALRFTAGYSIPGGRDGEGEEVAAYLTGENRAFGEVWLLGTARSGRHGLLFGFGVKVSQSPGSYGYYEDDYYGGDYGDDAHNIMVTLSFDIGYELRINRISAFFISLGVDIFAKAEDFIPALPRFRMGFTLGS